MREREKCDKQMLRCTKEKNKNKNPHRGRLSVTYEMSKCNATGCVFTKTLRPDLVKKANMEWKMLSRSWGMVHGVGFL